MKHLKKFETNILELREKFPNFKEGDIVICIDPFSSPSAVEKLEKGKKYQITKIENIDGVWRCLVKGKKQKYYCFRFKTEIEYTRNKYNL